MSNDGDGEGKANKVARLPSLNPDGTDRAAAVLRGLVSAFPFVGGAIAEIVNEVIPGQRIDRLAAYLEDLARRLEQLELPSLGPELREPGNVDLFEDGGAQAARAMTERRLRYITNAVANGIAATDRKKLQYKRLLSILGDVDDEELLLLRAYQTRSADLFAQLRPAQDKGATDDRAMWVAMHSKLRQLHLLEWKEDMREIDLDPGRVGRVRPETVQIPTDAGHDEVTDLGHLLLTAVGFTREPEQTLDEFFVPG